jgi:xylitol oxidase
MARTNWAGNHEYAAARVHRPAGLDELCELVARSPWLKVLGTRHSFNDVADTAGEHVSLERFDRVVSVNGVGVTLEAGVTYGVLCGRLHEIGFALHNLASLPHISVAGAVATATHGSGDRNGNLATAVGAMELVTHDGTVRKLSPDADGDTFGGAVVSLGALGVVTRLALDVVPAYDVRQTVHENLPLPALLRHFDDVTSAAYSVSLFTDWRGDVINQVWLKRRVGDDHPGAADLTSLGATPAARDLHPIAGISAENCTPQMDVPGPSHERLPHFRMEFTPSAGEELQSEYFVAREHAADALRAIDAMRERIAPLLLISEIRTIAADDLWLSPCYRRDSVAIHFTWKKDWSGVQTLLPAIEAQLAPFDARPHWGKLFTVPPEVVQARYERLDDFRELARTFDPLGRFRNAFLDRYVF